jgi:methionyl-tRNA formyltransferase
MFHDNNKPKIIFLGTPEFALPALEALIKNNLAPFLVITQPDKPVGRKQNLAAPPVKEMALANSLKVVQPKNKKELKMIFDKNQADVCVLVAYGLIIPDEIINLPKFGFLNIHPSLLPKYRGSSPVQSALLSGDSITGVSIIRLTNQVDAGPIVAQKKISISDNDNAETLHNKLSVLGAELLIENIHDYINGDLKPTAQDESKATYCQKISRQDGQINWLKSATEIKHQFQAFNPWPGVFTLLGSKRLKITDLSVLEGDFGANLAPGQVFLGPNNTLAVKCGQGALELKIVQLEGKKEMSGAEFLRGQKDLEGKTLK